MPVSAGIDKLRPYVAVGSALVGVAIIAGLYFMLSDPLARVLLDRGNTFPYSVQNAMWVAFCVGLGEIFVRFYATRVEIKQIKSQFLPEDERSILQAEDLAPIYARLRKSKYRYVCFLPRLIDRCVLQFQASRSSAQSASLLNTSIEMFLHEVDLRYNMIRYLCWVIPSLGFIGTVVGIGRALEYAGSHTSTEPDLLTNVTRMLAVSFNGTFLALVMASILVLLHNIVQSKEEHALNFAGQYCLDNLINRLYVGAVDIAS